MSTPAASTRSASVRAASAPFRAAMAHVPTAVSVVTTLVDGEPHGTTVSAFTSLSVDPPMLLVSLDNRSTLLSHLRAGSVVGVNVLSADQEQVAAHFARKDPDKFCGLDWDADDGAPRLAEHHAWMTLSVTELVPAGDHTIVLGTAGAASVTPTAPLVYWQRTYGTHTAA